MATVHEAARPRWSRRSRWVLFAAAAAAGLPASLALAIQTHVVAPGETLSAIADQYGVSIDELATENGITNPDLIFAGQSIEIGAGVPATTAQRVSTAEVVHTVADGETLTDIATQFGTTVDEIVQLNGIADPNQIAIGRQLRVPAAVASGQVTRDEARQILRAAETEFGLPSGLLLALAWQESGWQQAIVSGEGAIGITQVLPATADWAIAQFIPDAQNWRGSATDNARMGAAVLAYYLHRTGGDQRWALAAYYQGWRSVTQQGVFAETLDYVNNVLALVPQFQ